VQGVLSLFKLQEAHATLHEARVTFVDDNPEYLAAYIEPLQLVTDGKASFIQGVGQPVNELVEDILATEPDIVLIDYFLCLGDRREDGLFVPPGESGYSGADIVAAIREREGTASSLVIIGFSADDMFKEFAAAGANGATTKLDPIDSELEISLGFNPLHVSTQYVGKIVEDLRKRETKPSQSFSLVAINESGSDLSWFAKNAKFKESIDNYRTPELPPVE
jgi:CheY-like chemotaxis protein